MDDRKIPVTVALSSSSRGESGVEEPMMQLICRGEIREMAKGLMLRYEETQQDEETGETMTSMVYLTLQEDRVTMTRPGAYSTAMVFVKDTRFEGAYHTPFGDLKMAFYTTGLFCQCDLNSGHVHLEYQLDMQGNYAVMQIIDVKYFAPESKPC